MNKCIVILGGSLTALALARIAERSGLGLRVILASDQRGIAHKSRYGEKLIFPSLDPDIILKTLELSVGNSHAFCIADSDRWLKFIFAHRDRIEAIFSDVLHPSQEALEICLDKNKFLSWCKEKSIKAPISYAVDKSGIISPEPVFPLLLRPELTQHETNKGLPKAVEVRDKQELQTWIKQFREVNVEPAISESLLHPDVRQYSVGLVRHRDGEMLITVAEKIRSFPEQCSGGTYVVSSPNYEVEAFTRNIAQTLGYYGIGEAEIMFDVHTETYYIIELNARPWVQFALAERIQPGMLRSLLCKKDPYVQHNSKRQNSNIRWLNFNSDLFVCFSSTDGIVRLGRYGLLEYFISIARANSFALYDPWDMRPFLFNMRHLIKMLWKSVSSDGK